MYLIISPMFKVFFHIRAIPGIIKYFKVILHIFGLGHLEMVRFLLEAGADQEHKTDEMHTALMEACMVRLVKYIHEIYLYIIHRDSVIV